MKVCKNCGKEVMEDKNGLVFHTTSVGSWAHGTSRCDGIWFIDLKKDGTEPDSAVAELLTPTDILVSLKKQYGNKS